MSNKDIQFSKGLSEKVVKQISEIKDEPEWMLKSRLKALKIFETKDMPTWGADLSEINFNEITYYSSSGKSNKTWDDVPAEIKQTFDDLGIPEHEKELLAGVSTQYDSEVIYHNIKKKYENSGIVFESIEDGLSKYPEIFKKYFGKLIPASDNKFAALNSAVWSGGSFVYVPKGVKLNIPIETYFRINVEQMGQFERTLIIADEGAEVHYIEGCTAPQYSTNSLHAAVVEIFALKDAKVKYTTIQNWSNNIYNLVTKRAKAEEGARVEWVDVNLGSKVTMKYPAVLLAGENSSGKMLSLAIADEGQDLDTGAKMIHLAPNTQSSIYSKTISSGNGKAVYRGISKIHPHASNSKASVTCDGLLLNNDSKSYAYPYNTIMNTSSTLEHEASVSKVSEDQLNYLISKGLDEDEARQTIISGFAQPIINDLPLEYSVELERLLELLIESDGKGHQKNTKD